MMTGRRWMIAGSLDRCLKMRTTDPGDSFETAERPAAEVVAPISKPEAAEPRLIGGRTGAGGGQPAFTLLELAALVRRFLGGQCLAIRGITRETLLDHLLQAAESGLAISAAWCLTEEKIAALNRVIGENPPKQIRPLLPQLPPGTCYEEVQIYLKCRTFLRQPSKLARQ